MKEKIQYQLGYSKHHKTPMFKLPIEIPIPSVGIITKNVGKDVKESSQRNWAAGGGKAEKGAKKEM